MGFYKASTWTKDTRFMKEDEKEEYFRQMRIRAPYTKRQLGIINGTVDIKIKTELTKLIQKARDKGHDDIVKQLNDQYYELINGKQKEGVSKDIIKHKLQELTPWEIDYD